MPTKGMNIAMVSDQGVDRMIQQRRDEIALAIISAGDQRIGDEPIHRQTSEDRRETDENE